MIIEELPSNNNMKLENIPWIEKYRPKTLDELISQERITNTLQRFIDRGQLPNMLFYGSPGTGTYYSF